MNQLLHLIVTDSYQSKVDHTPASFSPAACHLLEIIVLGLVVKNYNVMVEQIIFIVITIFVNDY